MTYRALMRDLGVAVATALAFLVLAAAPSRAETRFGYIDSGRIFLEYTAAKEAQARFDRQVQGWRDEAAEKEKLVNQLRAEVRDQSPILSSLKRQERDETLQKAISDYERFIQEVWGPQGRATQENERATSDVVRLIRAAVEKVAGEKNLNLVFDAASGVMIYADKTLDVTADVLTELNAAAPGATGP
jgi:outer membrane protein